MTGEQSRKLKIGDRVCWVIENGDTGTVTQTNWAGVTIRWANGVEQSILHNDMNKVN